MIFWELPAPLFNHKYMKSPERQFNALTPDQEKKKESSNAPEATTENVPIAETESAMSYLGVSLEKSKSGNGQFVPKKEQYEDFILFSSWNEPAVTRFGFFKTDS